MEEKKNIVSKVVDWVTCAMCGQILPVNKENNQAICVSCGHLQKVDNESEDKEKKIQRKTDSK